MRVYGGCIEPGGMELDDDWWEAPCPECRKPARHGHVQQLEGGWINAYFPISCEACGLHEGFRGDP